MCEDKAGMDRFKETRVDFGANASAVIAKPEPPRTFVSSTGVAVFAMPIIGAMAEAAIGGQRITYVPK